MTTLTSKHILVSHSKLQVIKPLLEEDQNAIFSKFNRLQ